MDNDALRAAILEDHPATLDQHRQRLRDASIVVAGGETNWADFEALLARQPVDVGLLDVRAPRSADDSQPYSILQEVPRLLEQYPRLALVAVSMHGEAALIEAVVEAGVSGYIVKDEFDQMEHLGQAVRAAANGGIVFSDHTRQLLTRRQAKRGPPGQVTPEQLEALALAARHPQECIVELARRLGVRSYEVRKRLAGAYLRLGVDSREAAVVRARQLGLIAPAGA